MPSAAGGVIDRSVGHSAYYQRFRSLLPQISFRKLLSAFSQITNTFMDQHNEVEFCICAHM